MAKNKEKAGAGRTIIILLVVLLLLLTAGAYGYGVYYFSSHFLPGSMVNGFNCSYMASEDTEDLLNQRVGCLCSCCGDHEKRSGSNFCPGCGAFLCVYWNCEAVDQRSGPFYLVSCF